MSQDDVERVARAICEIDSDDTWEDEIDSSRAHYRWLARVAIAALPPQGDGLAELRALLDEHDKAHGETKYTPSKQPVYAMTMDYLHRQTFAAMYAHVRAEIERTKGTGQ